MYANEVTQKEIGERLRQHRKGHPRVSLYVLAEATNNVLSAARISNYEQGTRGFGTSEAKILSRAFRKLGKPITAGALLGLDESDDPEEEQAIVYLWRIMSDACKLETLAFLEMKLNLNEQSPKLFTRFGAETDGYSQKLRRAIEGLRSEISIQTKKTKVRARR